MASFNEFDDNKLRSDLLALKKRLDRYVSAECADKRSCVKFYANLRDVEKSFTALGKKYGEHLLLIKEHPAEYLGKSPTTVKHNVIQLVPYVFQAIKVVRAVMIKLEDEYSL